MGFIYLVTLGMGEWEDYHEEQRTVVTLDAAIELAKSLVREVQGQSYYGDGAYAYVRQMPLDGSDSAVAVYCTVDDADFQHALRREELERTLERLRTQGDRYIPRLGELYPMVAANRDRLYRKVV